MIRKSLPVALAAFLAFFCLAGSEEKTSRAESITIAELRDHMFFLASDALGGRAVGSEGYEIAAHYIASQFRAAGLEPIVDGADGNKTYQQEVPLVKRSVSRIDPWVLTTPEGEREIPISDSIKAMLLRGTSLQGALPVVFAGFGISEPEHGWDDLEGLELEGKAVIILAGTPKEGGKPVLPKEVDNKYFRGGTYSKLEKIRSARPALIIVISSGRLDRMWPRITSRAEHPRFELAGGGEDDEGHDGVNYFLVKQEVAEQFFAGQQYNPIPSARESIEGYRCFELEGIKLTVGFEVGMEQVLSWNVVGIVRGTDPDLAEQFVSLGAHLDHVGPYGGQIYNGADDNASGSIGIVEVAEAVAMAPPRRSVVFVAYAAEEVGLYGSRYFVDHCPVPLGSIIANINLDMIGRTAPQQKENRAHYVVGSAKICDELKETVVEVNERTVNWPLELEAGESFFRASDQVNFHRKGIPTVFFFSGIHPDLHKPTDDPEKIEFDKMQKIAQLVYELAMELGNTDDPPCSK